MSRRVLTFFVLMFALQVSWAGVSAYCMHETGKAAQHLGHHQHAGGHDGEVQVGHDKQTATKKATAHSHCSSCVHATFAVGHSDELAMYPVHVGEFRVDANVNFDSLYLPPPERPQWAAAVLSPAALQIS